MGVIRCFIIRWAGFWGRMGGFFFNLQITKRIHPEQSRNADESPRYIPAPL